MKRLVLSPVIFGASVILVYSVQTLLYHRGPVYMLMPTLRKYKYYAHKYKSFLRKSWALLLPPRYLFQGHSKMKRNKQKEVHIVITCKKYKLTNVQTMYFYVSN